MIKPIDIVQYINSSASTIKEEELDEWIVPKLMGQYSDKIDRLAVRAYGSAYTADGLSVALLAFRERTKAEIRKGVYTYIFKSQHWKVPGRDINSYLITTINRLAERIKWDHDSSKKINVPICPGCKFLGYREYTHYEGKQLRCLNCSKESIRLSDEIALFSKTRSDFAARIAPLEARAHVHKVFALHSRKGFRCPSCDRFIPVSAGQKHAISCPYSNCSWFGKPANLEDMAHPLGLGDRCDVSLNDTYAEAMGFSKDGAAASGSNWDSWQDRVKSDTANADVHMMVGEQYATEFSTLMEVITTQMQRVKDKSSRSTSIQKALMYEAYKRMLERSPEEMVSYLVHLRQGGDFPIQARIFQEYVRLLQNAMPLSIDKAGEIVDIISLTDPNLCLFTGVSKYKATVTTGGFIANNTTETYTGGRKFKQYGPCFIGMVLDIVDLNASKSIKGKMVEHSFVQIRMANEVAIGTPVEVTHFRMIPHYEMGNLVYLQRIRRKIVDSVFLRLNGKRREITR